MPDHDLEQRAARHLLVPSVHARVFALGTSGKKRDRVVRLFVDGKGFRSERVRRLPDDGAPDELVRRAVATLGSPPSATCYLVSERSLWDGERMPLDEALSSVVGRGWASLLLVDDGRAAYHEGEGPSGRCCLV